MVDLTATLVPLNHKLYKHFKGFSEAYTMGPNNFFFTINGPKIVKRLQTFQARDDDVSVVTFPKTGTTWMQEIVYVLRNNVEKAKSIVRDVVFPYAEINAWEWDTSLGDEIEYLDSIESPRQIKFHLNYSFLPPDTINRSKIIYVCRNVKDTIVSDYHFLLPYAPYITHIKEFWKRKHEKNIFFTTYEKLQEDQEKVIKQVAQFLDISVNKEEVKIVANHCKFDNMKKIPTANKSHWGSEMVYQKNFVFMRKGKVGNWSAEMSPELIAKVDHWIYEQTIDYPHFRHIL
uniref:Sulfotransferase domain-containing protein n=1 Tax=Strigamia maritima TaxID=126957 RepID=T1II86_STRMM